ncbi:ATP-binding protein [Deinococcus sp. KSM4-11]|uniref:ATP-binding protein n=1 Tax=Deinococcus sp. KSM4-11 TaxID=2568654 RepID=UPI001F0ED7CF|nr:ATP-binding protein [Deinococcus sp. KSM4-11]
MLTPRQLQAVIDANGDCIKVLDLDARVLTMNSGGQQVMEIDDFQQCHNVVLTSWWDGDDRAQLEAALDAARAGETRTFVGSARTFKGTSKRWFVTISPLRDDHGQITHLLSTSRDITAQHRAEEARQAAQAQLEQQAQVLEQKVQHQTQELEERATALDAFVRFTEAVGTETDLHCLAHQAVTVVQAIVSDLSVGYYELDAAAGIWRGLVWSDDVSPEIVQQIRAGVPLDAPDFAEAVRRGEPVFVGGWDAADNSLSEAAAYGVAGFVPLLIDGDVRAIFAVGKQATTHWFARDEAMVRAVARGLGLAMERAVQAQQLQQQRDDLNRRTRELETLLQLTGNQSETADSLAVIKRAQGMVLELLPPGFAAYYEAQGGRWRVRVQTGAVRSALLQAHMDAGFPVGHTPSFDSVAQTGEPAFVEVYDAGTDVDPEVAQDVAAHATLPVIIGGQVRGLFNVPLYETRSWTAPDQAVLMTAVHYLAAIIERVERSLQLIRSNTELQAANQELEAFTYSVSHDLRTPVRHVEGFAALTAKELAQGNLSRAERHVGVVRDAAKRMEALLDAMLTLSRAGRAMLNIRAVPLVSLVDQAQHDVTLLFPDRPVVWSIDPLPTVQGDAATLQQVVTHLLENAVKFSPGHAEVHVWAEEREQEWAIFVQDKGVGFDPQYAGKLFGALQRLHLLQEFGGAGIGLATVKRIVARHGGQVWADGSVGQGATFGFSLPKTVVS